MDDKDLAKQVGYLTRAIEDNTKKMEDLKVYVKNHMVKEERTVANIHRWLVVLAVTVILMHGSEINWIELLSIVI